MVLRGRRLTVVLSAVLVAVIAAGVGAAMAIGAPGNGGTEAAGSAGGTGQTGPSPDKSVQITPNAAKNPRAEEVRLLLQTYFDAINTRDFETWVSTVTPEQSSGRPQKDWEHSYSMSKDSSIKIIDLAGNPLTVRLWFTSEQPVEFAPADLPASCINWDVTYALVQTGGRLVIGNSVGSNNSKAACR